MGGGEVARTYVRMYCMSGDEVMSGKSDLLLIMSQEGDENKEFTNESDGKSVPGRQNVGK